MFSQYTGISLHGTTTEMGNIRRSFHTCEEMMGLKKKMEKLIRKLPGHDSLKTHFKTPFKYRKERFYVNVNEFLCNHSCSCENIQQLNDSILSIYDKKNKTLNYLENLANDLDADLASREEMRDYYIEYWKE